MGRKRTVLPKIMKFFGKRKLPVSSNQVHNKTGLPLDIVCRGLLNLTEQGILIRTGGRGKYRYVTAASLAPPPLSTRSGALVEG